MTVRKWVARSKKAWAIGVTCIGRAGVATTVREDEDADVQPCVGGAVAGFAGGGGGGCVLLA